ncbi:putative hypothetical protein [Clostridium botulinum BKT015925]|nr:putative hypothetical protein [Clostridium botulinum BKT015925]
MGFLKKYINGSFNDGVLSRIKESGGDTKNINTPPRIDCKIYFGGFLLKI